MVWRHARRSCGFILCVGPQSLGFNTSDNMKVDLLEEHFKNKPILTDNWAHYSRQKDNYAGNLPCPDYSIDLLVVKIVDKQAVEGKIPTNPAFTKKSKFEAAPNTAAVDIPGKGGKKEEKVVRTAVVKCRRVTLLQKLLRTPTVNSEQQNN